MCGTVVRRRSSAAMPVRRSSWTPISSRPRPSTSGPRPTETSITSACTASPSPKCTVSCEPSSSTPVHCLPSCSAIPRRLNCFASSFEASASSCGMSESSISTIVTSLPKRAKIDANSHPMMPPPRMTSRRGTCSCASRPDDRLLERDVLASVDGDRVRVAEPTEAFHPLHAVRLEEGRDTGRHLLDDAGLPRVRGGEVEPRLADLHAELREALFRLLQRERRLHPRLRRDAADAEAGTAEFRLLLDARDLRAQLGRADRGGVSPGAAPEDGDVDVHGPSLFESVAKRS